MVRELLVYPDERINIACTDVRKFDEKLFSLLEDMKETMEANNLEALSAIQIAYPYNIVVIKTSKGYEEYINPRILSTNGKMQSLEKDPYYPNIELEVPRYQNIKLIYQDRNANNLHKDITDPKLSSTLQQMIDHLFGGTFLDKVSKDKRDEVIEALKNNGFVQPVDTCPTFSKKDYFVSFTDKLLFFMGLSLLSPLFDFSKKTMENIYLYDKIAFPLTILLMIGFFLYAQYEAKKYRQCSSCQVGNNIGVMIKRIVISLLFAIGAYLVFEKSIF